MYCEARQDEQTELGSSSATNIATRKGQRKRINTMANSGVRKMLLCRQSTTVLADGESEDGQPTKKSGQCRQERCASWRNAMRQSLIMTDRDSLLASCIYSYGQAGAYTDGCVLRVRSAGARDQSWAQWIIYAIKANASHTKKIWF